MASNSTVIAEQAGVSHGSNGFYSLRLIRRAPTDFVIEVSLSLFFDFIPNESDSSITWTAQERTDFSNEWQRQIPGAWNQNSHVNHRGCSISIAFVCDVRAASTGTQWQARVMKLKDRSAFRTSAVWRNNYPGGYDASFDSNDDLQKALGDGTQTAMIHEFGHMIGNGDEYKTSSSHYSDKPSIMHSGSTVRARHLDQFVNWAKPHIDALPGLPVAEAEQKEARLIAVRQGLLAAPSAEAEVQVLQSWVDNHEPGEILHFEVRRRGSGEPVPIDQISVDDFSDLEIVFQLLEGEEGEPAIWQPRSSEAFELLFVE